MTNSISPFYRLLTILITTIICLAGTVAQGRLVEKVAAVVNGEVITSTELDEAGQEMFARIRQSFPPNELDEKLSEARQELLDRMIDDLLVKQKANELHIGVSDEEADNAVARIAAANNLTVEELYEELDRTGIGRDEYRKNLSRQILQSKLVNYEIQSKIVISDKQAREYYENVYTKGDTPAGYHLLQIGITWGEPGSSVQTKAKAKKRAEGIRKQAVSDQDFGKLAESFSELPSAKAGGDIGFFKEDEMAESLRDIIVDLKPGQVSKIIETDNSFLFYRLVARNLDGTPEFAPYSDVKEEILDRLHQEELERRYKKWLQEIKEQAIIKKPI